MNDVKLFLDVVECMQEQVYIRDLDMKIVYINPAAERLTGFTLDEARGKKCYEVFGDEHLTCRDVCPVEQAIADDMHIQHHEGNLKTRNGDVRKMRVSINPLHENNKVSGATIIMQDITQLKELEDTHVKTLIALEQEAEAGKRTESNFKRAQSVAEVGSWHLDIVTGTLNWSDETYRIFGLEQGTPVTIKTFFGRVHPDDRQLVETTWRSALKGTDYDVEHRIITGDTERWVLEKAQIYFNVDGTPVEAIGTVLDITEKRLYATVLEVEREMAKRWSSASTLKERLEVCLETAITASSMDCGGIYLVDESNGSHTLRVHRGLPDAFIETASDYPADSPNAQLINKGTPLYTVHRELLSQSDSPTVQENLRAVAVIPMVYQGKVIACLNVASHTMNSIPEHAKSALQRISTYAVSFVAQEMQEEKRRQIRRDLEMLINTIDDMLFILDLKGNIIEVNGIVSRRLGYDRNELVGKHHLMMHPEYHREDAAAVVAAMIAGEVDTYAIPLLTKDMHHIPVETKVTLGQWEGQQVIIGVSRDISERERLEAERIALEKQRQQVEKAESLSCMAAAVAHNFNNMLTAVIGNLDLAMEEVSQNTLANKYICAANSSAERAIGTSHLMLTYLGQAVSTPEPLDLGDQCRKQLTQLRTSVGEGVRLWADLPDPGPVIEADTSQVGQVLNNLVINAVEATMSDACEVKIAVGTTTQDLTKSGEHIVPTAWKPSADEHAYLSVTDKGRGIEKACFDRIFDPFYTDKFTGRGLGLAVTLGIVKSLKGCIIVQSEPEKGSCFKVLIPLAREELRQPQYLNVTKAADALGGGTALLAEDTGTVREVSQAMLEQLGFEVLVANDGVDAVEIFKKNKDQIRLVLCDYNMPRMNGWETLSTLRKLQQDLPVIMVSGLDEAKSMGEEYPEQPQAFLHKPFRKNTLKAAVRQALCLTDEGA